MVSLALLLIGFSVVSAVLLGVTHFRASHYHGQGSARTMGIVLIFALAGLQWAHWGCLYLDRPWVAQVPYRMLLFTVAPAFWGYSQPVLRADRPARLRSIHLVHGLPIAIAPWLSAELALPIAFLIGAGYLLALARNVYQLRAQRDQFAREIRKGNRGQSEVISICKLGTSRLFRWLHQNTSL